MVIHGDWCNNKIFSTRCKRCGKQIYIQTCDCGSRVIYDEIGGNWPKHICRISVQQGYDGIDYIDPDTQKIYLKSKFEKLFPSKKLTSLTKKKAKKSRKQKTGRNKSNSIAINQLVPRENVTTREDGIVTNIEKRITLAEALNIPIDTSVGKAVLGDYAGKKFVRMTINVPAETEDVVDSLEFYVRAVNVHTLGLIKGDFVRVNLRGVKFLDRKPIWICDQIDRG